MALNIKNERVSRLANELAEKTGETITEAVGKAIEERLDKVVRKKRSEGLAERLRLIGEDCAKRLPPGFKKWDYDADLYDERGLPK
ncbi:MAG: type II toxin-antitoxin system VapB family antitoxin [Acidobacteria bacterium]|nr:type II toxin-antitoxin system VapB family antitoxin [Acidobacteriota bacterium]